MRGMTAAAFADLQHLVAFHPPRADTRAYTSLDGSSCEKMDLRYLHDTKGIWELSL